LILALLALMILTVLGLTLAASSATEVQTAANFRWSRKAFYNAEAGVEVGRFVLSRLSWTYALPKRRLQPWQRGPSSGQVAPARSAIGATYTVGPSRDLEMAECDRLGNGMGYGIVLFDGKTSYQNVATLSDQALDGAFTLWVRRPLVFQSDGSMRDYDRDDVLILVSEGVAPAAEPGVSIPAAAEIIEVTLYSSLSGVTVGPPAYANPVLTTSTIPFKVGSAVCH
jgi:hypothetical protein